jgi:hypothetical protein
LRSDRRHQFDRRAFLRAARGILVSDWTAG